MSEDCDFSMSLITPVILCGGGGTRLWPRSRRNRPKPFLPLLGERTLFQQTLDRVADPSLFARPVIVAGAAHVDFIREQAGGDITLIVEPAAKNTAPAIALAARTLPADTVMLVCPSDHHIADQVAFLEGVERAAELARDGWLVSFGIAPTSPETGYGYIRQGERHGRGHRVARFVEKPDLTTAQQFLAAGDYVWNGGIFAFRAGAFLAELARFRPDMVHSVAWSMEETMTSGVVHPSPEAFGSIAGESIDYAVMENTDKAAVVSADMGWSDIGSWDALHAVRGSDADGNHVAGGPAELRGCRNVMVDTDGRRVSVIGLEDVVVVVDGNEVLVTSRGGAQQVGKLAGASGQ